MKCGKNLSFLLAFISFQACNYFLADGGICTDGDLRFSGDNSDQYSGRLEVCVGEEWGSICDDQWDIVDARIACKQAGIDFIEVEYYTDEATIALFGTHQGSSPVFLSGMMCSGSETNLLLCPHSNQEAVANITDYFKKFQPGYINPCPTDRDVGIHCRMVHGSDIRAVGQSLVSPLLFRNSLSIGCTVYVGENVEVQPSVSWTMPNGQQPQEQTDTYFVPRDGHVTGIAQSTLHIASLGVADAGRYQCRSAISVPMRETTDIVDVIIQLPKPNTTMILITGEEEIVRSGGTLRLQCLAQLDENSGTTVQFLWKKDGKVVNPNASGRLVITTHQNNTHIWSLLTLSPFSTLPDNGLYMCEGTASAPAPSDFVLPATDTAEAIVVAGVGDPLDLTEGISTALPVVQMRLIGVSSCETWVITNEQEKLDDLTATLTDFLTTTCQCTMFLNNSRFQCFQDQDAVIFRAQVWPIDATGAELLQEFVNDRSSLTIDGDQLDIDPSCATNVSSFAAPGCSSTSLSDSGTDLVWMIITGILSGVLVVAIATATVIILALIMRLCRHKNSPQICGTGLQRENGIPTQPCVAYHPDSDTPVAMTTAHSQQESNQQLPTQQPPSQQGPSLQEQRTLPAPPTAMHTYQQLVPLESRYSTASNTASSYDYI